MTNTSASTQSAVPNPAVTGPMLFTPFKLRSLELPNRIVIAPMCQYSADEGRATDWHLAHLGQMAMSGAGLLVIEATAVEPVGRITAGCLGLWDDDTEAALARVRTMKEAGGVSEQQLADAEAGVRAGRAGVDQAAAAVSMTKTNLGFHTLRAPIDGVITNGPDNAGILVGAGTPLFLLEDLSALQVKATAPESAGWIREGIDATVLPGAPGASAGTPAKVVRVLPSLDPVTRRVPVEVRVEAPPPELRAHAFARVRVSAGEPVEALGVPKGAVVARPDFCVLLQEGEGKVRKVPVEVLAYEAERTLVRGAGLAAGATAPVDPPNGLGE